MLKTNSPKRLWDDCIELQGYIQSNTFSDHFLCEGQTPETIVMGNTPDISPFVQSGWYDWIWFRDTDKQFPSDKQQIGRYLGPSLNVGSKMTAKILKQNGETLYWSTYDTISREEVCDPVIKKR